MNLFKYPGAILGAIFAGATLLAIGKCSNDNELAGREPGDITISNTWQATKDFGNNVGSAAGFVYEQSKAAADAVAPIIDDMKAELNNNP